MLYSNAPSLHESTGLFFSYSSFIILISCIWHLNRDNGILIFGTVNLKIIFNSKM